MILANPFQREIDELHDAYAGAFDRVMRSGWYILGKEVEAFEQEFSSYLGSGFGIGCASGLDALMLSLKALGIGPGDEVITTPLSAAATALAITHVGATPVFADVLPGTLSLDPDQVGKLVTARTKAVIPVHLYGYPAETQEIHKISDHYGLAMIEDCAQSVGARDRSGKMTGTRGRTGCFSFYPTKNLGAFGDAGFICTDDPRLAEVLRKLRHYGQSARYVHDLAGYNSRLDELQAALLREKLKHLEPWTARRREIAGQYDRALSAIWTLPSSEAPARAVYHLFPVQIENRDQWIKSFQQESIEALVHYPTLIPEQMCYSHLFSCKPACESWPIAFRASRRLLSLPVHPYTNHLEVKKVIEALKQTGSA